MFGIGMQELAIILVVALLIFGPKRLPELAKTLGKGLAEFRKASNDLRQSFMLEADPPPQRPTGPDPLTSRETIGRPAQLADDEPPASESGHGDLADEEEDEQVKPAASATASAPESTPAPCTDPAGPSGDGRRRAERRAAARS